jgi:hypothetical protein
MNEEKALDEECEFSKRRGREYRANSSSCISKNEAAEF